MAQNKVAAEGLRERKRRETRATIERAAVMLVDELGYDSVTVAMICDRAVVSQGTFFNYFPTKDAAIIGITPAYLNEKEIHAAYEKLLPLSPYRATLSIFLKVVSGLDWTTEVAEARSRVLGNTPALMRQFLDGAFGYVAELRAMLATYLQAHPEYRACSGELSVSEEAGLVVSEALSAAKFALERAAANPGSDMPDASDIESIIGKIIR